MLTDKEKEEIWKSVNSMFANKLAVWEIIKITEQSCDKKWKAKIEDFFDRQINICRNCIWQNDRMSDLRKELLGEDRK